MPFRIAGKRNRRIGQSSAKKLIRITHHSGHVFSLFYGPLQLSVPHPAGSPPPELVSNPSEIQGNVRVPGLAAACHSGESALRRCAPRGRARRTPNLCPKDKSPVICYLNVNKGGQPIPGWNFRPPLRHKFPVRLPLPAIPLSPVESCLRNSYNVFKCNSLTRMPDPPRKPLASCTQGFPTDFLGFPRLPLSLFSRRINPVASAAGAVL